MINLKEERVIWVMVSELRSLVAWLLLYGLVREVEPHSRSVWWSKTADFMVTGVGWGEKGWSSSVSFKDTLPMT
jgi:hypothetical protein